ncbi:MAG TPA: flagellar basal body-associated FliL family protein, partial [bacterium]|nr:flagellar basal body-associated FliL family protein [bacterium]
VLSEKLPKIKAVINRLMNNLPYAELATERGQKKCTDRMVAELNEALAPAAEQADAGKDHGPAVYAAYFTTLVAQ